MAIQRKCPSCHSWNDEESHCKDCGALLDPKIIAEDKRKTQELKHASRELNFLDRAHDAMKYSRWMLVRAIYWVVYSVWFVLFSIVSFFLALIAAGPG